MALHDTLCACGCGLERPRYLRGHARTLIGHTVEDRGFDTPCWISLKAPNSNGYVVVPWYEEEMKRSSSRIGAHRLAYMRAKGPIPAGHQIDHLCKVPNCVNPDHLEAVPPRENIRRAKNTKLTPDLVRSIRAREDSCVKVAADFGVSAALISLVRRRELWADVD